MAFRILAHMLAATIDDVVARLDDILRRTSAAGDRRGYFAALYNRVTLRVRDGVFVLETMLWPDEVRKPDFGFLDEDVSVRPQELAMAGSLIETLAGDFDPSQYTDGYREALQAV